MKAIAIITARGGSKRIPRKNIKRFLGKPIIQYSIEAALQSGIFDVVMVSTDDLEIAEVAKKAGAEVPFLRSEATSTDFSSTADVLVEVLERFKAEGKEFEYACCCYPTAPFITPEKLKTALEMLQQADADTIMPIAKYSVPIWWALKLNNNQVSFHWPENELKRSQDLPAAYFDTGQFYFFNVQRFLKSKSIVTNNTIGLEVPETEVQDIDNEEDWNLAEIKYRWLHDKQNKNVF
jgi:pseudaminic acid cytidylyltransferase